MNEAEALSAKTTPDPDFGVSDCLKLIDIKQIMHYKRDGPIVFGSCFAVLYHAFDC